jgi:hypothetical protein
VRVVGEVGADRAQEELLEAARATGADDDHVRVRVISRYRCAASGDLSGRLQFGPAIVEPVSFAMDRRMLIGIKQRAERAREGPLASARRAAQRPAQG